MPSLASMLVRSIQAALPFGCATSPRSLVAGAAILIALGCFGRPGVAQTQGDGEDETIPPKAKWLASEQISPPQALSSSKSSVTLVNGCQQCTPA
jgi:hypothetical protein